MGTLAKDVRNTLSASTLIGDHVVNRRGEDLGKIEDLMIEPEHGRVSYAIVSGGHLGLGDKLFAVPMQAIKLSPEDKRFILDVDKEKLKKAPGFDKNHWPDLTDRSFDSEVCAYYGCTPYGS